MTYNKSDEFYEGLGGPCGCMGSRNGEPYCPCVMQSKGLPKSIETVEENKAFKAKMDAFIAERHERKAKWIAAQPGALDFITEFQAKFSGHVAES